MDLERKMKMKRLMKYKLKFFSISWWVGREGQKNTPREVYNLFFSIWKVSHRTQGDHESSVQQTLVIYVVALYLHGAVSSPYIVLLKDSLCIVFVLRVQLCQCLVCNSTLLSSTVSVCCKANDFQADDKHFLQQTNQYINVYNTVTYKLLKYKQMDVWVPQLCPTWARHLPKNECGS